MSTSIRALYDFVFGAKQHLETKGYQNVNCTFRIEPDNDEIAITFYFYNSEWSSTYAPSALSKTTEEGLAETIQALQAWVFEQEDEDLARESALIRDFAAIKERIDASKLSDLIKAEVQALMEKLSSNAIEDKSEENPW